eukprot:g48664.t1
MFGWVLWQGGLCRTRSHRMRRSEQGARVLSRLLLSELGRRITWKISNVELLCIKSSTFAIANVPLDKDVLQRLIPDS